VALTFMAARLLMPKVLHWIVRTRVRETFLLGALGACLGMGMLTSGLDFPMPLGAFLAGLVLSESNTATRWSAEVLPFRDLFNSLFFISLGMLLRFDMVRDHLATIVAVGVGSCCSRPSWSLAVVRFMMYPLRTAVSPGCRAQVGEFSFVLAGVGLQLGLLKSGCTRASSQRRSSRCCRRR
jgi:CPA2 family monovalent cation:H+ antiporter-2